MFEFYRDCTFEGQNVSFVAIVQVAIQLLTLGIAFIALNTARKSLSTANENLKGASRTQSVQAHMNLIALQSEVSKNFISTKIASRKVDKYQEGDMEFLLFEQNNSYMQYISSVDKLASIINTPYFPKQFSDNNEGISLEKWKKKYYNVFKDAVDIVEKYNGNDLVESEMAQNIIALLGIWDEESTKDTPKIQA